IGGRAEQEITIHVVLWRPERQVQMRKSGGVLEFFGGDGR
ncbi:MAG: hypothetical protein RLZZ536_698, partial [Planctomycetota bacterium]